MRCWAGSAAVWGIVGFPQVESIRGGSGVGLCAFRCDMG